MTYNRKDKKKIAELAYHKWQADGAPQGHDGKKYWLEAEQELTKADVTLEEITNLDLRYDIVRSLR